LCARVLVILLVCVSQCLLAASGEPSTGRIDRLKSVQTALSPIKVALAARLQDLRQASKGVNATGELAARTQALKEGLTVVSDAIGLAQIALQYRENGMMAAAEEACFVAPRVALDVFTLAGGTITGPGGAALSAATVAKMNYGVKLSQDALRYVAGALGRRVGEDSAFRVANFLVRHPSLKILLSKKDREAFDRLVASQPAQQGAGGQNLGEQGRDRSRQPAASPAQTIQDRVADRLLTDLFVPQTLALSTRLLTGPTGGTSGAGPRKGAGAAGGSPGGSSLTNPDPTLAGVGPDAARNSVVAAPTVMPQQTSFSETVDGTVTVSTPGNVSSLNATFTGSADGSRTGILPGNVHATVGGTYQGSGAGAEADPGTGTFRTNISGSARLINGQFVDQNAKLNITSPGFNVTGAGSGNFTINQSGGAAKGTFTGAAITSGGSTVGSATMNYNSTLK